LTLRRVTSPELIKVKNEKCDLFGDSHSTLAKCRNRFSQPLNIHGLYDVKTELLTAESPLPDTSDFKVVLTIEKLKVTNHQVLMRSHQNLLRQAVAHLAVRSLNLLFLFGIRRHFQGVE
jgi:hypothetical protein